MSVNDKEMEVLLRRYAKNASRSNAHTEHLDADELNAFAEGALPAAARQRYVSHLADCDHCRKLAGELVVAQGGTVEAQVPASEALPETWWRKLGALFSPPALRYAAFALVLVAVVGVSFLIWRRPTSRPSEMVAQNHPETAPVEAAKPAPSESHTAANARAAESPVSKTFSPPTTTDSEQTRTAGTAGAPPPPPAKIGSEEEKPALAARQAEVPHVEASPSYAPQPPAEVYRSEGRVQEPRKAGEPAPSGPRRSDYDKNKVMDRAREGDVAKERDEDQKRAANQAVNEKKDDSVATVTSSGTVKLRRGIQEGRVEAQKSEATEEAAESRSVGGRKFKRQGNAWVDSKFKASRSVRNVARGSEEFDKLDSGLRSIAQQLSGEIVVVWKGKAYRIR